MRIYLGGPMRGIPQFNFPAFYEAARELRAAGHEVFNPAEKDDDIYGTDMAKSNATGNEHVAAEKHGFDIRRTMEIDCTWICRNADAIALLPGWENSRGVKAEKALAEAIGIEVMYL